MVPQSQKKCLIVEIDTTWQQIISRALEGVQGVTLKISTAPDFDTALQRLRAENFDLMFLDLSLDPEKAHKWGRDLLVSLSTAGNWIPPTIVVSGEAEFDDILDLMNNFRDYVFHFAPKQTFSNLVPRREFLKAVSKALRLREDETATTEALFTNKVFVSHGPETKALQSLRDFLEALGVKPVIAEHEAAEGRSVVQHVQSRWIECQAAIILMTRVAKVGRGYWTARGTLVEIGALREYFRQADGTERVIYLKEKDVDAGAMVEEKVRETFTQGNMTAAFIHVARELRASGLI